MTMPRSRFSTSAINEITPEIHGVSPFISNMHGSAISPSQLRAARGLLNWGRTECANAADLSPETIKNIEHDTFTPTQVTSSRLLLTFAAHGVEFINLMNFSLNTLSGNDLCRTVNVSGAVLVLPHIQKQDDEPSSEFAVEDGIEHDAGDA